MANTPESPTLQNLVSGVAEAIFAGAGSYAQNRDYDLAAEAVAIGIAQSMTAKAGSEGGASAAAETASSISDMLRTLADDYAQIADRLRAPGVEMIGVAQGLNELKIAEIMAEIVAGN